MLKVELHTHTADDPLDAIPHTTTDLIDRAAELGFQALAITLHDRQLDVGNLSEYARQRGLVLIPGIERTIQGKHVLLINFPPAAERVDTFEDVAALKARADGLVIAPHPFFPLGYCLGGLMDRHASLFDAVEFNHFYTPTINFNRAAVRWARAHRTPLVGNSDVHDLAQLGKTYSLVDATPTPAAICAAIREGRVEVRSRPLSLLPAAALFASMSVRNLLGQIGQLRYPTTSRSS